MTAGESILAVVNFLTEPAWLVTLFVVLLLLVALSMYRTIFLGQ